MNSVRLYGYGSGESSFAQVTRGMTESLVSMGELGGLYPLDGEPEAMPSWLSGGEAARLSLNIGAPEGLLRAHRSGGHEEHWLLLAPNSETIPHGFIEAVTKPSEILPRGMLTGGLLTPSAWGAKVLSKAWPDKRVLVAPHGVSWNVHRPHAPAIEATRKDYAQGLFNVLHMSSTEAERKSTKLLLGAWKALKDKRAIPATSRLHVVMNPTHCSKVRWWAADYSLTPDDVTVSPGLTLGQRMIAALYNSMHLVCQPSRAEGFGMVPLEALATGTPVAITTCTGHSEYAPIPLPGMVEVRHGASMPLDDFPGATAPSVTLEAIAAGVKEAYDRWIWLSEAAEKNAEAIGAAWSWEKKNEPALRAMIGAERTEA